LKRLIVSFSAKCALHCPFCYAPFNGAEISENVLSDILDFAANEEVGVLTFGGGDPFQYSIVRPALRRAKELGFLVHVDTHGIGMRPSDYPLIRDAIDLVGLPLDGPKAVHDSMRQRSGHFESVMSILQKLLQQDTRVKINTVVGRMNIASLSQLADDLKKSRPITWSLYQFMELPEKHEVNQMFMVSDDQFLTAASELTKSHPEIAFEIGSPNKRKSGYLFVQTDGTLFTHSPRGVGYCNLGTIYTNDWREKFFALNHSMLPELSGSRYKHLQIR
jgi:MoaA/NifB/PqqE/SkfB family radical SAM enzyme